MRESDGSMGRFTYILHMMTSCLDIPLRINEEKKVFIAFDRLK